MPDKHSTGFRIAGEQPPIPVGAAVKLYRANDHAEFRSMLYPLQVRIRPVKWKGPVGDAPRGLFLRAFELLDECSKSRGDGSCADWGAARIIETPG